MQEDDAQLAIAMHSDHGTADLEVAGAIANEWPAGSVFASRDEGSAFFAATDAGAPRIPSPARTFLSGRTQALHPC